MNFEFKSTFKQTSIRRAFILILESLATAFFLARNNFILLLAFNISVFFFVFYLYSENYFIPAVYGSKPSAESWITLFETLAFVWILSTAFAFSELVFQITKRYQFVQRLNSLTLVAGIKSTIRSRMVLLVLLVTMLIRISNYTYTLCFRDY